MTYPRRTGGKPHIFAWATWPKTLWPRGIMIWWSLGTREGMERNQDWLFEIAFLVPVGLQVLTERWLHLWSFRFLSPRPWKRKPNQNGDLNIWSHCKRGSKVCLETRGCYLEVKRKLETDRKYHVIQALIGLFSSEVFVGGGKRGIFLKKSLFSGLELGSLKRDPSERS